jgi:hypothetical protein
MPNPAGYYGYACASAAGLIFVHKVDTRLVLYTGMVPRSSLNLRWRK